MDKIFDRIENISWKNTINIYFKDGSFIQLEVVEGMDDEDAYVNLEYEWRNNTSE